MADFYKKQKIKGKGQGRVKLGRRVEIKFQQYADFKISALKMEILCYNEVEKIWNFDMSGPGSTSRNDAATRLHERGG
ncbi:MAG: hypothetical protein HDT33_05940 [Clostridiales bacterium]|nr:hypothetical protein [Clostridiales bacterium]